LHIFSYAWQSKKDLGFYDTQFFILNTTFLASIPEKQTYQELISLLLRVARMAEFWRVNRRIISLSQDTVD
ncbi:hypothetical protein GBAR_LOCUS1081, partial [Geodia barretti]